MIQQKIFFSIITVALAVNLKAQRYYGHKDWKNGYTISYPETWRVHDRYILPPIHFLANISESGQVVASVIVMITKAKNTETEQIIHQYRKQLISNGEEIIAANKISIRDQQYLCYVTVKKTSGHEAKMIYYLTVNKEKIFTIKFSAVPSNNYNRFEEVFETMINSLTFS